MKERAKMIPRKFIKNTKIFKRELDVKDKRNKKLKKN